MKHATVILTITVAAVFAVFMSGCDLLFEAFEEEVSGVVSVSGRIDSDTNWSSDNEYLVTGDVDLRAALTIEPGTRVVFEQGNKIEVRDSGALIAEGTSDDQILFTGTDETSGWWDGIWIRSEDPRNSFDQAVIEYAGGDFYALQLGRYMVTGSPIPGSAAVTNTIIRHTDGHGVYLQRGSELTDFDNNTITSSASYPVTVRGIPASAAAIGATNDLTGNGTDAVRIFGDNISISSDAAFVDPGVPYRVDDADIDVSGAVLTIAEGVTMEFDSGSSIRITSGGGLRVEGTENSQVLFTGVEPIAGYWTGINFVDSDRPDNSIEHAVIEYGGSEPSFSGWNSSSGGNITLGRSISSAQLSIGNSEIRHSTNYGIYVYDGDLDQNNVEFTGNDSGEVYHR